MTLSDREAATDDAFVLKRKYNIAGVTIKVPDRPRLGYTPNVRLTPPTALFAITI